MCWGCLVIIIEHSVRYQYISLGPEQVTHRLHMSTFADPASPKCFVYHVSDLWPIDAPSILVHND